MIFRVQRSSVWHVVGLLTLCACLSWSCEAARLDKSSLTGESEPVALASKCTDRNHFETRSVLTHTRPL